MSHLPILLRVRLSRRARLSLRVRLQGQASVSLQSFTEYVSSNWINGTTWSPSDWTVFKKAVRTNNDIEGWHHGLNRRASGRGQLPLYLMIQLLHKEAKLTALQIRLVSWQDYNQSRGKSETILT